MFGRKTLAKFHNVVQALFDWQDRQQNMHQHLQYHRKFLLYADLFA